MNIIDTILSANASGILPTESPSTREFIAAEQVGDGRVVTTNSQGEVYHADNTNPAHAGRMFGLTLGSAAAGSMVKVFFAGLLEDSSWQWNPNKPQLFLSTNGVLTQTIPTTGFSCVVGYCVSATKLFVDIQPPTILSP